MHKWVIFICNFICIIVFILLCRVTFDSVWAPKLLVLCACSWRRYTCKLHENHNSKWKIQNTAGHLKRWIILLNKKFIFFAILNQIVKEQWAAESSRYMSVFSKTYETKACVTFAEFVNMIVCACVFACEREKKICVLVMSRES